MSTATDLDPDSLELIESELADFYAEGRTMAASDAVALALEDPANPST